MLVFICIYPLTLHFSSCTYIRNVGALAPKYTQSGRRPRPSSDPLYPKSQMPPKAIPDRWIPYKACGEVIEGTRFICFKVPLKRSVQQNVSEIEQIWDIPTILSEIPKLGAVIDLTNTARYYNPQDFLKANILHKKILMPGRIVPPESSVKEFMKTVDEFLGRDAESLVGVHCTHGLNRTGYMVCRYMRDRLGIPAPETIRRFEAARGYKIERDIYINGILGRKNYSASIVGKDAEIVPIEHVNSRRNNFTYSSPLGEEDAAAPSVNRNQRFGNSYNDNRYGNNRFGINRNASSGRGGKSISYNDDRNSNRFGRRDAHSSRGGQSGLFSCYTNRYNSDWNTSSNRSYNRGGDRSDGSQPNWRTRDEAWKDGGESNSWNNSLSRNGNNGISGYSRRGDRRNERRDQPYDTISYTPRNY